MSEFGSNPEAPRQEALLTPDRIKARVDSLLEEATSSKSFDVSKKEFPDGGESVTVSIHGYNLLKSQTNQPVPRSRSSELATRIITLSGMGGNGPMSLTYKEYQDSEGTERKPSEISVSMPPGNSWGEKDRKGTPEEFDYSTQEFIAERLGLT